MAVAYPILKQITLDGEDIGLDPGWGEGFIRESTLDIPAGTYVNGLPINLPKGIFVISVDVIFPTLTTTGATTYAVQFQNDAGYYGDIYHSPNSISNSKLISRLAAISATQRTWPRVYCSRAVSGVFVRISAIQLTDMIPD